MRARGKYVLASALGVLGALGTLAGSERRSRAQDGAAAIDSRVASLHAAFLDEKRDAILYRALEHNGSVWEYKEGQPERPFQTIPHKTLALAARKKLAALLSPKHVTVIEKSDFPSYSYLLEFVTKTGKISRVDFHTEGGEKPIAFWMPVLGVEDSSDKAVQIGFAEGGLKEWRSTLDSIWKE